MKIFIKNMACIRCKMAIKEELEKIDIRYRTIDLGEVETVDDVSREKLELLRNNLKQQGFELMENRKDVLAEKIKTAIIDLVNRSDEHMKIKLSVYLSEKLNYEYSYLGKVFTEVKGTSIEKFFVARKIERVKELLVYNELNLHEISILTQYSSVAHLSNQFKKVTGLAPSEYRHLYYKNNIGPVHLSC